MLGEIKEITEVIFYNAKTGEEVFRIDGVSESIEFYPEGATNNEEMDKQIREYNTIGTQQAVNSREQKTQETTQTIYGFNR